MIKKILEHIRTMAGQGRACEMCNKRLPGSQMFEHDGKQAVICRTCLSFLVVNYFDHHRHEDPEVWAAFSEKIKAGEKK